MKLGFSVLVMGLLGAQTRDATWEALSSLAGEWEGEGAGEPGAGKGSFSFTPELQGKLLIRRNRADYPATKDHPAFSHEDWMIIFRDPGDAKVRANYYDSEDHLILYEVLADGSRIVFLSAAAPNQPRYRFTYERTGSNRLKIRFEIAPPGKPGEFRSYIEAAARRK